MKMDYHKKLLKDLLFMEKMEWLYSFDSKLPKIKKDDLTPEEFQLITDGCGGRTFKPYMYYHLEEPCREHDLRYQSGYRFIDRMFAEFMLFIDIGMIIIAYIYYGRFWIAFRCFLVWPIYIIILLLVGWCTFSIYINDGKKQKGFTSKGLLIHRAKCRKEEVNPKASHNERNRK